MKKQAFILLAFCLVLFSCKNEVDSLITVNLNPSFITLDEGSNEPMKVNSNDLKKMSSSVTSDSVVYAIQVYENDVPYYYGLFNDVSKMQLALTTSKTYKFKVSAYKAGTGKGLKTVIDTTGTNYFLPNKIPLKNKFINGDALKDIDLASSALLNGQTKTYSEVDAFYATKTLTVDKGTTNIDFSLLRMGFGINFTVDALTYGNLEIYIGNDTLKLNNTKTSAYTVRQFNNATNTFANIHSNANTFGDSIAVTAKWTSTLGTTVTAAGKYMFLRNYQKTINIQLNTTTNSFNFEGWANNTVTDIDGNVYKTVTIGTQTWMAENLKVAHYRDGSVIPNVTVASSWASLTIGAYCDYNNLLSNSATYGRLYNWYTANESRNIAPIGWHIPTDAEWSILTNYVSTNTGVSTNITKALAAKSDWSTSTVTGAIGNNLPLNNSTGFNAFPSGNRMSDGIFHERGTNCNWLSSTESTTTLFWSIYLSYNTSSIIRGTSGKAGGYSIRCVKD